MKDNSVADYVHELVQTGVFELIGDGISIQDSDFRILYQNSKHKSFVGDHAGEYCYEAYEKRDHRCEGCPVAMAFEDGLPHTEERSAPTDKGEIHVEITASALRDKTGKVVAAIEVVRDITNRKRMENELREAAITDDLTACLNRRGFFALAEHQCKVAIRSKKTITLLFFDLDRLKIINDELGHEMGDQALVDVATILKRTFRSSDIIARIGGDEFAVLIADLQDPRDENTIISNFQNNLVKHNDLGLRNYELAISVGIAYYEPEHPCSLSKLISQADKLMYQNKSRKKDDVSKVQ
jgi:diguanylate cyclase (GGDEF)-like protein